LSHPEVSDEPEEETVAPQALGTASSAAPTDTNEDEGIRITKLFYQFDLLIR
jgi:hypothetical protein